MTVRHTVVLVLKVEVSVLVLPATVVISIMVSCTSTTDVTVMVLGWVVQSEGLIVMISVVSVVLCWAALMGAENIEMTKMTVWRSISDPC